jgi:hypothetical protein
MPATNVSIPKTFRSIPAVTSGSRVLEIDPEKKEIVWQYTGESSGRPAWTF